MLLKDKITGYSRVFFSAHTCFYESVRPYRERAQETYTTLGGRPWGRRQTCTRDGNILQAMSQAALFFLESGLRQREKYPQLWSSVTTCTDMTHHIICICQHGYR